jgi:hypothetical protein
MATGDCLPFDSFAEHLANQWKFIDRLRENDSSRTWAQFQHSWITGFHLLYNAEHGIAYFLAPKSETLKMQILGLQKRFKKQIRQIGILESEGIHEKEK